MQFFRIFLPLTVAVLLFGCGKDDSTRVVGPPGGNRTPLNPVSNLEAYSASDTSVGLAWVLSSSESNPDFNNYYVRVKDATGIIVTHTVAPKGESGVVVNGLAPGVVYVFEVSAAAVFGSSTYMSSVSRSIRWAPARRMDTLATGQAINVYETSDSSGIHSGLVFYDPVSGMPKVVSTSNPGADSLSIDLYIRSESIHNVSMRSPSLLHPTWKRTIFSTAIGEPADSLDDPRYSPPDTALYRITSIIIDSAASPASEIYYFKTDDGHYGRILLKLNPGNNTLIWGKSPAQYLTMEISYQTIPYNRYSKSVPVIRTNYCEK